MLTVLASDLGVQPLCNHATVNITVTDSNDNTPLFSQHLYSSEVNEHARVGDVVLQVSNLLCVYIKDKIIQVHYVKQLRLFLILLTRSSLNNSRV